MFYSHCGLWYRRNINRNIQKWRGVSFTHRPLCALSSSGKDQTHIVTVHIHWLHLLSQDGDCVPGWTIGNSQFDSRRGQTFTGSSTASELPSLLSYWNHKGQRQSSKSPAFNAKMNCASPLHPPYAVIA